VALSDDEDVTSPDPAGRRVPVDDEVAKRLAGLVASLRTRYGDSVVTKESIDGVAVDTTHILPPAAGSCDAAWIEMGASELILVVGIAGRWEMNRDLEAVKRIEDTIDAVVHGRVIRLFGLGRSSVIVTLDHARTETSTRYDSIPIPLPGSRRFARRVVYAPYDPPKLPRSS
jgi:hypothetical protein